jgi:hypothetical protein
MCNSSHSAPIHILDDISLLNIFYHDRLAIFDVDEGDIAHIAGGEDWVSEQWWYKLAHVCHRWRNLVLGSPSYLHLCLVCACGTPVADSPPLPLVIDYIFADGEITAEEEEGIILALTLRDRVRRVRLRAPISNLQMLIGMAIDGEYPVLEHLIMEPPMRNSSEATTLMLPEAFQAPRLRHLSLRSFALPIRSRLLTTAAGLVTLILYVGHPNTYIQPSTLHQWLSGMPQLETLLITFLYLTAHRDADVQLMRVTLPNLRWFGFQGVDIYMGAVLRRIIAPRLERLSIQFFKQSAYSAPHLLRFINTSKNFKFDSAVFEFDRDVVRAKVYPPEDLPRRPRRLPFR